MLTNDNNSGTQTNSSNDTSKSLTIDLKKVEAQRLFETAYEVSILLYSELLGETKNHV